MEINPTLLQFVLLLLPLFAVPGITSNAVSHFSIIFFLVHVCLDFKLNKLFLSFVFGCRHLMRLAVTLMVHSIEILKVCIISYS